MKRSDKRVRAKNKRIIKIIVGCLIGGVAVLAVVRQGPRRLPNILLVTVCSLRQDHMGCYGYQRNTSPNIDRFAARATRFTRCYAHIPWTSPGVIALLLGRYPVPEQQQAQEVSLPRFLREQGYMTYGVIGTNMVSGLQAEGLDPGCEVLYDHTNMVTAQDRHTVCGEVIAEHAIKIIQTAGTKQQPLFLWLFFKDPHWKYLPPAQYAAPFMGDEQYEQGHEDIPVYGENGYVQFRNSIGQIGEARLKDADGNYITDRAYYIAQYDGEIAYLDAQFGKILAAIERQGSRDEWLIVFSADHGESLGEEGYYFDHGYKTHPGLLRLPLLVKFPGQRQPATQEQLLTLADIQGLVKDAMCGRRLRKGRAEIFFENAPLHEPQGYKIIGCIWEDKRVEKNLTTGEIDCYRETAPGIPRRKEPVSAKGVFQRGLTRIEEFFQDRQFNTVDSERLRSLGYL